MEEALQNKNRQDLNINISLRLMIQTSRASDDGGKGRRGVDSKCWLVNYWFWLIYQSIFDFVVGTLVLLKPSKIPVDQNTLFTPYSSFMMDRDVKDVGWMYAVDRPDDPKITLWRKIIAILLLLNRVQTYRVRNINYVQDLSNTVCISLNKYMELRCFKL